MKIHEEKQPVGRETVFVILMWFPFADTLALQQKLQISPTWRIFNKRKTQEKETLHNKHYEDAVEFLVL